MATAVIEERSSLGAAVTYRFTHAFVRQTLYEEIIAPRRILLHQQAARAIEDIYASRLEEHATELAEHFSHSSDPADLAKAVSYGEMAAGRAVDVYAYGEVVRLLEQALKVQEVLDPEDKARRCDLLLVLGEALDVTQQYPHILDAVAPQALAHAEAIGDSERASSVCSLATRALLNISAGFPGILATPRGRLWSEQSQHYTLPGTAEQVRAEMILALARFGTGHPKEGIPLLRQALEMARSLGDLAPVREVGWHFLFNVEAPQHFEERLRLANELLDHLPEQTTRVAEVVVLHITGHVFLQAGDRQRCEELWGGFKQLLERAGTAAAPSISRDANIAYPDGRLDEAVQAAEYLLSHGEELGRPGWTAIEAAGAGGRAWLLRGEADRFLAVTEVIDALAMLPSLDNGAIRALCLAHLGHDAEVVKILEKNLMRRPGIGTTEDETAEWQDVHLLESAVIVGHDKAASLLLHRLANSGMRTTGWYHPTVIARYLGAAATLLGRPEEARVHYQEALKVATDMRFRPEIALTRLQLAELLLEHYTDEKPEALEYLDFAIEEFREMKMQPSLERGLRLRDAV